MNIYLLSVSLIILRTVESIKKWDKNLWQILNTEAAFSGYKRSLTINPELRNILSDLNRNFTVFAPTNQAVQNRGNIEDPSRLHTMTVYHIVEGIIELKDLEEGKYSELYTLLINDRTSYSKMPFGKAQVMAISEGRLSSGIFPDAKPTGRTLRCLNGIIHHVDVFMIPPIEVPEGLDNTPYTKMLPLVRDIIDANEGLTLFLPQKSSHCQSTLRHAVVGDIRYRGEFKANQKLTALDGTGLHLVKRGDDFLVNGVKIIKTNIPTSFGVVHILDGEIEPSKYESLPDDSEDRSEESIPLSDKYAARRVDTSANSKSAKNSACSRAQFTFESFVLVLLAIAPFLI